MGNSRRSAAVLDAVLARYDEPHRRYHNGRHVRLVVSRCIELFTLVEVKHPSAVVWAALWHDAIYDPRSSTNERDSADLAMLELAPLGVSVSDRAEVSRLIMLTAGHVVAADDIDGAVLADADLAVLGAPAQDYADYVSAVRREYSFVDDAAWQGGRAAVLRSLLALPRLFRTVPMAHRDVVARYNLTEELRMLTIEG